MPGGTLAGLKAACLNFSKIVFRVAVQFHHANLDQRIVLVRPDLGQVEWVIGHLRGVGFRHDLYFKRPLREVSFFDALVEVTLVALTVLADDCFGFGVA